MTTRRRQRIHALAGTVLTTFAALTLPLQARLARRRHADGGYTTETVIVTALLAAAAILIVGVIVAKVLAKANAITL